MGNEQLQLWEEGSKLVNKFCINTSKYEVPVLPKLVGNMPEECLDLLHCMLKLNPKERIDLKSVLKHHFFTKKSTPVIPMKKVKVLSPVGKSPSRGNLKPNFAQDLNHLGKKKKEHNEAKEVIKRKLISKLGHMERLDLSKVNETDCEHSFEGLSNKHIGLKTDRHGRRSNNFKVKFGDPQIRTKEDLNQIRSIENSKLRLSSRLQSKHKKNSLALNGG